MSILPYKSGRTSAVDDLEIVTEADDDDARAQAARRALIREMLASGDRVVLRAHRHYHEAGYAVFVDHREGPVYACTLTTEPLPEGIVDSDIVTMDAASPDPERTVWEWLSCEFPGVSLKNVQVEHYEGSKLTRELTSCDFVGDSGCSDPDCWQCHSPLGPEGLRTLAKNLAIAATLCRAHRLGFDEGMDAAGVGEGYPSAHPWTPGCRRSAL